MPPSPPTSPSPFPTIPYWLLNVPPPLQPTTCPPFLTSLSPRDIQILNVATADFKELSWPAVKQTIQSNRIDQFCRRPLDHRNYLCYMSRVRSEWGSVGEFVRRVRLGWGDVGEGGEGGKEGKGNGNGNGNGGKEAFEDVDDIKIIYNDWPYGIDKSIVHLCVWTKFPLDVDENDPNGDLTSEMREKIDKYVDRTFRTRVPAENIIWFKNWAKLKSIHSMEHFHVMMKDPDMDFIKEVTNGDQPASSRLAEGEILQ